MKLNALFSPKSKLSKNSRLNACMDSDECGENDVIFRVALQLYYHPSINRFRKLPAILLQNLDDHHATTTFERAVIAVLSYFVQTNFKVACSLQEVDDVNLVPAIPQLWRNQIQTLKTENVRGDVVTYEVCYYLKMNSQNFTLHLYYKFQMKCVLVSVHHAGVDLAYSTAIPVSRIKGLNHVDENLRYAYASNIIDMIEKAFYHKIVKAASLDEAPSDGLPPVDSNDLRVSSSGSPIS